MTLYAIKCSAPGRDDRWWSDVEGEWVYDVSEATKLSSVGKLRDSVKKNGLTTGLHPTEKVEIVEVPVTEARTMKITKGATLQSFLREVIGEGAKSALAQKALEEKENQAKHSKPAEDDEGGTDIFSGGDDGDSSGGDGDSGEAPQGKSGDNKGSSKTMDDETEKLKQGDVDPKDVVEKLNSIRSGRSFKDSAVAQPMEDYITSLSKAERTALYAFLRGIAQIVTGEVPAKQAEDPSKHPADIKMDKSNQPHVKHVEPNRIKGGGGGNKHAGAPDGGGHADKGGHEEEDTSAPAPITPKRR